VVRKIITCQDTRHDVITSGCHCGAAAQYEEALKRGLVVLSETETIPGLHAWFDADMALDRLCAFKGRDRSGFIYLFPDLSSAEALADFSEVRPQGLARLMDTVKAPITMVFPSHDADEGTTVAVRVVSHPFMLPVIRGANPLASTSANAHGAPSPQSLREVDPAVREFADVEVRHPLPATGIASTVVDFSVRPVTIRRLGAINEPAFFAAMKAFAVVR
jgi:L-threonylcarbamoyladenylate synthase